MAGDILFLVLVVPGIEAEAIGSYLTSGFQTFGATYWPRHLVCSCCGHTAPLYLCLPLSK